LRFPLPAEAVPRRHNKAPATILLLVGPHSRHGRNRNSRTLAAAKQDNDHGPRQPKGPLAGTIATTEQRKPWSGDSVKNQQHFPRYRHFLSTSIWTEGTGGRIGLENGVLGAIHRLVIGQFMALSTIHSALLPPNAIMRQSMPICALPQWLTMPMDPQFS